MAERTGLLVVGHGTRDPAGVAACRELGRLLAAERPHWLCETCFLELAEPDIAAGIVRLAERGATQIAVAPLLLFSAGHAQQDVPAALAAARQSQPQLRFVQAAPLDCHPALVELSALRFRQFCQGAASFDEDRAAWVLVARGNRDPLAGERLAAFAAARQRLTPLARAATCFVAIAEPRLRATLEAVYAEGWPTIVVQGHFLFPGLLPDEVRRTVEEMQANTSSQRQWGYVEPLGPHPLLVQAALARIDEAQRNAAWSTNASRREVRPMESPGSERPRST